MAHTKVTTTVREYDDSGRVVKETVTEHEGEHVSAVTPGPMPWGQVFTHPFRDGHDYITTTGTRLPPGARITTTNTVRADAGYPPVVVSIDGRNVFDAVRKRITGDDDGTAGVRVPA